MRPKKPVIASPYRYTSKNECEENGNHRVTPLTWPPPKTATQVTDPVLNMRCDLCGCWLIVYEAHATGQMPDIDVILPERKKQPA